MLQINEQDVGMSVVEHEQSDKNSGIRIQSYACSRSSPSILGRRRRCGLRVRGVWGSPRALPAGLECPSPLGAETFWWMRVRCLEHVVMLIFFLT